jgi:hypothetical protein
MRAHLHVRLVQSDAGNERLLIADCNGESGIQFQPCCDSDPAADPTATAGLYLRRCQRRL